MKQSNLLRYLFALFGFLCCIGLCGCVESVELSERALVQAIGIDVEDGEYTVTIQYFSPEKGGGQAMLDISKPNNYILSSTGSTLMEALSKAEQRQGKDIFYVHNKLLVIGKEAASQGVTYLTEYFSGNDDIKANVLVCIADSKASEVVGAQIEQGILPAASLKKLLENAEENGQTSSCELISVTRSLIEQNGDTVLPAVQIQKEEDKELITLSGLALVQDYHLREILPQEDCTGFLFCKKSVSRRALVCKLDEERTVTLTPVRSNVSRKLSGDKSELTVQIHVLSDVAEVLSEEPSPLSEQDLDILEQLQEKQLEQAVLDFYNHYVRTSGADYLGLFSNTTLSREEIGKFLSEIELNVEVSTDIRRNNQQN